MEKIPHHGDIQVRPHTAVRRARSYAVKNPPNDFKLVAAAVDLSSSNGIEDASSGRHATPGGDVISMSHRSDLRLMSTHLPFSQRPRGLHAAKLPECLRRLIAMRSAVPLPGQ